MLQSQHYLRAREKGQLMKKRSEDLLSVGEVSARSGVAISALHFYEKKGLISPRRNAQNQRLYPRGMLRVISLLKVAQKLGFSLEQIQEMFEGLPQREKPSEKDWKDLSRSWKKELTTKIELLIKIRDQLDKCIGCGCLSMKDCPLRNKDDKLSKKGHGAQLL